MTDQKALEIVIKLAKIAMDRVVLDTTNHAEAILAVAIMEDIKLDTKPETYKQIYDKGGTIDPEIRDYQIEIRGKVKGSHDLFCIRDSPVENEYNAIARYDVIASSLEEATDLVREYENSGRREHELVKCTMRLA